MKIKVKKIYSEWWAYVWLHRKLMGWVALSGVLVGLVVWLSIPNEYETDIFTVAEPRVVYVDQYGAVTNRNSIGAERIRYAILPSHYRRLMASPTFLLPLTRIPVTLDDDEHTSMTLYDYMAEHQRYPWWRYVVSGVLSIPRLMLLPFRGGGEDNPSPSGSLRETLPADREGIVRLTRKDARVLSALRRRLDTEISAEKQSVTLKVRMQERNSSSWRKTRSCSAKPARITTAPRTNMPAMPTRTAPWPQPPPAPNKPNIACGCSWPSANTAVPTAWCKPPAAGWPWSGPCSP